MADDLSRALAKGMAYDMKVPPVESLAAFLSDPANAPLLLAIPVVHDLQQRLERTRYLLNYVETVGMDGADFLWVRIAVQEAEAALAFFTKESTDGK